MRIGESNPFTDSDLGLYWEDHRGIQFLKHRDTKLGSVSNCLSVWKANVYWDSQAQFFDTLEEAQSWLLVMYRMR